MLRIVERQDDVMTIEASGHVTKDDFKRVLPQIEGAIEAHGKLRMLVRLEDVHSWKPTALLQDISFTLKHRNNVRKLAVVGHGRFERLATKLTAPLLKGRVRFFDKRQFSDAERWLHEAPRAA